jgi:signal transduction histidine kinase
VMLTIQALLELDGYHVTATGSAQHALELLQSEQFEVLLTDLRLEGSNGLDLLGEQRLLAPGMVSIVLTGYGSLDSAVAALRNGAYDYLLKPCDVVELRSTVTRAMERGQMAMQLGEQVRQLEHANESVRALNLELEARVARATEELRSQVAARDEFMATVAHDLKSPLTFIKGMAGLRRRRAQSLPGAELLLEALGQIERAAGRMAQQLDAFVDDTRLQAGRPLDLVRQPTDLVRLAERAVREREESTDRHSLHVAHSWPAVIGNWDGQRLARVLDTLLANALRYSPRGGAVEVSIDVDGDMAVLTVKDRVEGIPPAELAGVFDGPLFGPDAPGRFPGTGIGLAGVQAIVALHGGSVQVQSEVGHGSTFTVRLPLGIER